MSHKKIPKSQCVAPMVAALPCSPPAAAVTLHKQHFVHWAPTTAAFTGTTGAQLGCTNQCSFRRLLTPRDPARYFSRQTLHNLIPPALLTR